MFRACAMLSSSIRGHLLLLVVGFEGGNDAGRRLMVEEHTRSGKTIAREQLPLCVVELAPGAHFRRDIPAAREPHLVPLHGVCRSGPILSHISEHRRQFAHMATCGAGIHQGIKDDPEVASAPGNRRLKQDAVAGKSELLSSTQQPPPAGIYS